MNDREIESQEGIPGLDPVLGLGALPRQIPDLPQEYHPGWNDLVRSAHEEIVAIDPLYEAHQVKTKFGGLRLYLSGKREIGPTIEKYERLSYSTCELCGARDAQRRGDGWIWTLCDTCAEPEQFRLKLEQSARGK